VAAFALRLVEMASLIDHTLRQAVNDFFEAPPIRKPLDRLIRLLPPRAEVLIAGGAIRNLFIAAIHGKAPPTRDIDLFIGGLPADFPLARTLDALPLDITDMQGLRWHPAASPYAFDLCLLPRFIVIERFGLPADLQHLLRGIDFSVNAAVYQVTTRKLFQSKCIEAIRRRIIDFNSGLVADRHIMIYRVFLIAHKTGFRISAPVFRFLRRYLDLETMEWLDAVNRGKHGKQRAAAIRKAYDAVAGASTYERYLASRMAERNLTGAVFR
jgi:hypothetical protein